MGALDVAWEKDDMNSAPFILEYSPRFSPNPLIDFKLNQSYSNWKKILIHPNPYWKIQAQLIEKINFKYIKNSIYNN